MARCSWVVILAVVGAMASSCEPGADGASPDEGIGTVRQPLYAPPECTDPEVLAAMNAAAKKYNLPRWFIYAVVHRESSFDRYTVNPNDGGQGLVQLTGADHQGYPYPENLSAPNNSYDQWVWDMGLNQFGPWVDMNDVTPLANYDDAFHPVHNLDRYATVYAAPAYFLFQVGADPAENLRRVAYHWFRGLFDDNYPDGATGYFEGQWGYDAYVAQYKPAVEAEDGVWQGPPCRPPYSPQGCGSAPDGGAPVLDGGAPAADSGAPAADAGPAAADAGLAAADAGPPASTDGPAGPADGGGRDGGPLPAAGDAAPGADDRDPVMGSGCASGGAGGAAGWPAALLVLALLLVASPRLSRR